MRRRITLTAAATALLAVVLLAVPLAVFAARGYVGDERLELQRAAATAAASARGEAVSVSALRIDHREIVASIYTDSGRLIEGPSTGHDAALVRAALMGAEATTSTDTSIVVAAPVSDGDHVSAVIVLRTSLAASHHLALLADLRIAAIGAAAVLIAAFAAGLMSRRLAAPIHRLRAGAQAIGAGDLDTRISPTGVPEFDVLAGTLNDAAARIQTMLGRERSLSAEVSHQLRTPLTGLRLQLERLKATYPRDPRFDDAISCVDRLADTVTDVIALARDLPDGQQCAVREVVEKVSHRWYALLAESARPLRIRTDEDVPQMISLSSAAANQILDILIDNARAHGRGAIILHARVTDSVVAIDVSDEGAGPNVEPHQLFAPRDGQRPGGIGLPFARKLAEAERARLTITAQRPPTFTLLVDSRLLS